MPSYVDRRECGFCDKKIQVRKDGKLRPHGSNNNRCPGSGQPPVGFDDAIDWLLNSRYVDPDVREHFWHMADREDCTCSPGLKEG